MFTTNGVTYINSTFPKWLQQMSRRKSCVWTKAVCGLLTISVQISFTLMHSSLNVSS